MAHATPSQRATAVARVMAGESRRAVAEAMGTSEKTVRRWVGAATRRETPQAVTLADQAAAIAGEIEHHETIARHRLIERIANLASSETDLTAVSRAYRILSERALLREGKPTAITRSVDQMDVEIDTMLREMAKREAEQERAGS